MESKEHIIKVSSKGQIVLPASLRSKYRLEKGRRLFVIERDGIISLVPQTSLEDLCGSWPGLAMNQIGSEIEESREGW